MSYNPAFDPRDERNNREQPRVDEQYARDVRAAGMYNQPLPQQNYQPQPVYQTPVVNTPAPVVRNQVRATNVDVVVPRDKIRWGPILAGLVAALATMLILGLLGAAVGLTAATGDPNGGAAAAATSNANNYGVGAAIWAAVSALISFFIGGYLASRTAAVRGKNNGWLNGAMVWAIALPVILWLAGNGLGGFLNAVGFNLNGFLNTVTNPANPANPLNPNSPANPNTNPGTVQSATEAARNGAWGALGALLLGLIASSLGGFVGARPDYDDDDVTTVR